MLRRDGEVFFFGTAMIHSSETARGVRVLSQNPGRRQQQWRRRQAKAAGETGIGAASSSTPAAVDQARQRGKRTGLVRRRHYRLGICLGAAWEGRQRQREFL